MCVYVFQWKRFAIARGWKMLFYLLNSLHFLPSSILFSFARWYKVNRSCRWVVETRTYVASIPFSYEERHDSLTESRYPLRVISLPRWKHNDSSRCSSHKLAVGRREVNRRSSTSEMRSPRVLLMEVEGAERMMMITWCGPNSIHVYGNYTAGIKMITSRPDK